VDLIAERWAENASSKGSSLVRIGKASRDLSELGLGPSVWPGFEKVGGRLAEVVSVCIRELEMLLGNDRIEEAEL
jgi:hypothetical protein